jgi:hypothetical protein
MRADLNRSRRNPQASNELRPASSTLAHRHGWPCLPTLPVSIYRRLAPSRLSSPKWRASCPHRSRGKGEPK